MVQCAVATLLLLLPLIMTTSVHGHSYLVKPESRDKGYHPDTRNVVGCPTATRGPVTAYKAGEEIDVRYWRNNHFGGFVRWSLAPRGNETHADFDRYAFYYTCRESGPECVPRWEPTKPIIGDGYDENSLPCGNKIRLPDWLPAGDYVLQWTYYGAGYESGNLGWADLQFRSCADIRLTTSGTKSAPPTCPTFVGGDRVTKGQNKAMDQCYYYYTTDIVSSRYKGSNEPSVAMALYKYGKPGAVERCLRAAGSGGTVTTSPSATPAKPEPTPTPTPTPNVKSAVPVTPAPAMTRAPACRRTRGLQSQRTSPHDALTL